MNVSAPTECYLDLHKLIISHRMITDDQFKAMMESILIERQKTKDFISSWQIGDGADF
jgi:hypothetical protein